MKKKKQGRVVLLHGVRLSNKEINYIAKLAPAFRKEGFCIIAPRYGFLPAMLVGVFQWVDRRIADSLSAFITEDDIIVGHSNGGTLAYLISKKVKVKGVVFVNAALDATFVPNAEFVHVYYNKGDIIARLSAILPFHPWGAMGGIGYIGTDPRVVNIDQAAPPEEWLPPIDGHRALFQDKMAVRLWGKFMAEFCSRAIAALNNRR